MSHPMSHRFLVVTALLTLALVGVLVAHNQTRKSASGTARQAEKQRVFPSDTLAALDRVVQKRFAVVPAQDFGLTRLATPGHRFKAITQEEKAALDGLTKEGRPVVLFIVGRQAHRKKRGAEAVLMTRSAAYPRDLSQAQLKIAANQAFRDFKTRSGTKLRLGAWDIVAVPVRASQQACVDCHKSGGDKQLRLGEPLAVAMYAYARSQPPGPQSRL